MREIIKVFFLPPPLSLFLSLSLFLPLSLPISLSFLDNHQPEAENSLYVGTAAFNLVLESIFCPPTSKTYSVVEMVDSVEEYLLLLMSILVIGWVCSSTNSVTIIWIQA